MTAHHNGFHPQTKVVDVINKPFAPAKIINFYLTPVRSRFVLLPIKKKKSINLRSL